MVTSQISLLGEFSLLGIGDYVVLHTDLLKGRGEDLKPDPYLRKSPSLESLSRPPSLGFGNTRLLSASTGGLKPQSKLRYHVYTVRPHWVGGLVIFLLFHRLWSVYLYVYFSLMKTTRHKTCLQHGKWALDSRTVQSEIGP